MPPANFQQLSNFIWSVAELLRGPYRTSIKATDSKLEAVERRVMELLREVTS
jgi:hypothetical protein